MANKKQSEFIEEAEKLIKVKTMLCEGYSFNEIEKEAGVRDLFAYLTIHLSFFKDLSFRRVRESAL